jgi:dihydroorotase-like cyclic amidohydrolase
MTLLIKNAVVVNEGKSKELDLRIDQGRIEQLGSDINATDADQVIDAGVAAMAVQVGRVEALVRLPHRSPGVFGRG